jgi:hypothetical protein
MPEGFYEGSSRKELPAPMEPLSLDDAPQLPPKREAPLEPVASKNTPQTSTLLLAAKSLGLTLVVMAAIYAAYWFWIKPRWVRFSPPNGDCSVLMPGTPKQEDILATGFANLGGKRFIVSWRSSTKKTDDRSSGDNAEVSIGWIDLDSQRLPGVSYRERERYYRFETLPPAGRSAKENVYSGGEGPRPRPERGMGGELLQFVRTALRRKHFFKERKRSSYCFLPIARLFRSIRGKRMGE